MTRSKMLAISIAIIIGLAMMAALARTRTGQAGARSALGDQQALIDLENEWIGAKDRGTLSRILADDFVHPVASGDFLTKTQHIDWVVSHPGPTGLVHKFAGLNIRLYGDVGIANGTVVTTDHSGKTLARTVFTDVFAYRDGRWQAINGQETLVLKHDNRPN